MKYCTCTSAEAALGVRDGMLVGYLQQYTAGTHLYNWVKRDNVELMFFVFGNNKKKKKTMEEVRVEQPGIPYMYVIIINNVLNRERLFHLISDSEKWVEKQGTCTCTCIF